MWAQYVLFTLHYSLRAVALRKRQSILEEGHLRIQIGKLSSRLVDWGGQRISILFETKQCLTTDREHMVAARREQLEPTTHTFLE